MKRDMELIRAIMLNLESECRPYHSYSVKQDDFPGASADDIKESCRLIAERGLAKGTATRSGFSFSSITWEGHDFIDNARENKIWQAAKDAAGTLSFGVFKEILHKTAVAYALDKLGIKQ